MSALDLDARIRQLEDAEEIHDLFMRYGRFLDTKDWVPYSKLFTDTGQLVSSSGVGTATGPEEIMSLFDQTLKDVPLGAFHLFSNIAIEVDGDRATAKSMWAYLTSDERGWPKLLQFGHYDDVLVRDGSWKFQLRNITRAMGSPPYKR